ncbi:cellulase family glycosylhydrolase [Leclercia sp.]|uniref:cellulase family glycosylhydrolase n=1 Tax=Leclercia sp. TaxID=1898428 RepID=UPI0028BD8DD9|nr:cellulase family glycosylhydrolase [Leclercia sp.]
MERQIKRAENTHAWAFDATTWIDPKERITACDAKTENGPLTITNLQFTDAAIVIWLAGGGDDIRQVVNVEFLTSGGRRLQYRFACYTFGTAPTIVRVELLGPPVVLVGFTHPDKPPEPVELPEITVTPSSLTFPLTGVRQVSDPQTLTMENTGEVPVFLRAITMAGPFHQKNGSEEILQPGDSYPISVTFSPQVAGDFTGSISIDINDGGKQYATFSGTAEIGTRITTSGNQLITGAGENFRLRSINWFGAETDIYVPHGLWARSYTAIIDQIKAMGFNSIRLPLSGDLLTAGRGVPAGSINYDLNPALVGKTAFEVLSAIITYCDEKEIYVILDHHRRAAGNGADGSPVSDTYPLATWITNWQSLAQAFSGLQYVLGADLHNEPYSLSWPVWAGYAEQCGNAIHHVAPHWLIFVEGVGSVDGDSYWWGGQLAGVATRPVRLNQANRVVYSPHEYGQSVGQQSWLAYDGQATPANWPMNLYAVWRKYWGFIVENNVAPVWIGEFGGKFGTNGTGDLGIAPHAEYESQWLYHLELYMNGDFDGDGDKDLPAASEGISFCYWAFNPNSGDTGGIVQDDWTAPQAFKLRLLDPIMAGVPLDYLTSLDPISASEVVDADLMLVNHNGTDYSLRVSELTTLQRNKLYEPGVVHWFATNVNPNAKYSGQTWILVPGLEKTVRLAKADGSDLLATGGADTATIAKANLPQVALSVSGTAETKDLGTRTTSNTGAHSHSWGTGIQKQGGSDQAVAGSAQGGYGQTSTDGNHEHSVALGLHDHAVSGQTENMGSGQSLGIKNAYVVLAAWYRVS